MAARRPLLGGRRHLTTPCVRYWAEPPQQFSWSSRRKIQIGAAPSTASPSIDTRAFPSGNAVPPHGAQFPDARFEIIGAPYSLLSVSLSASQNLYTRRGTLVGVSGKAENAVSTLSILAPFRRAILGIPFLYQKISSVSPLTALIATKSPITSFVVVHLDGTTDWMVAQRQALLAWTGSSLAVRPTASTKMSLTHWGSSKLTGRGLVALVGKGQVYEVNLETGEEFVVHPCNLLGYTVAHNPPLPYRLKSSSLRLQVPSLGLGKLFKDTKFVQVMLQSDTWKAITRGLFHFRTWLRRTVWGDRLFLCFRGPTTILLQTRSSRLSDVLTSRDVNEIADTEPGALPAAIKQINRRNDENEKHSTRNQSTGSTADVPTGFRIASAAKSGKVEFEEAGNLKSLSR